MDGAYPVQDVLPVQRPRIRVALAAGVVGEVEAELPLLVGVGVGGHHLRGVALQADAAFGVRLVLGERQGADPHGNFDAGAWHATGIMAGT